MSSTRDGAQPLILAVDDDEDNLGLLTTVIELVGCAYITAPDGETALSLAQSHQPDLIVLDFMLPDLDGLEIVKRLKRNPQTQKIPVVAVTALASIEDTQRMLQAGCDRYLPKPYDIDRLEDLLKSYFP